MKTIWLIRTFTFERLVQGSSCSGRSGGFHFGGEGCDEVGRRQRAREGRSLTRPLRAETRLAGGLTGSI
jgi:hypothetical protein